MSNSNYSIGFTLRTVWPAQFGRKLVLGTRRKWPRPRRDVGTSRDRDVETETTTLLLRSGARKADAPQIATATLV